MFVIDKHFLAIYFYRFTSFELIDKAQLTIDKTQSAQVNRVEIIKSIVIVVNILQQSYAYAY